jgi:hypothetical protein
MVGQVPLIGSLTPVQLVSSAIAFFIAYLAYSNAGSFVLGIAIWLWAFFTLVLVLGRYHWQFLNKFRQPPHWSSGRRYYLPASSERLGKARGGR